jgi:hypothetical protein
MAATHQTALTALELPLEFVHHDVECAHSIACHAACAHDVATATPDECDLANFAFGDAPVRLLDESHFGALYRTEVAVEVTNLLVDRPL